MTREEMRTNLHEPEVKGLSVPWTEVGQEIFFRFSHSQEEKGKFDKNFAYYGVDMETGAPIKFWSTMGITQAFIDLEIVSGDVVLVKFLEQVGQFKRFTVSVDHVANDDGVPF